MISAEIIQLGITHDMHVMKDSPGVISIERLVVADGYDRIRRHKDPKAVLIARNGSKHQSWTDNFTAMLSVNHPSLPIAIALPQNTGLTIETTTAPLSAAAYIVAIVDSPTTSPLPS